MPGDLLLLFIIIIIIVIDKILYVTNFSQPESQPGFPVFIALGALGLVVCIL